MVESQRRPSAVRTESSLGGLSRRVVPRPAVSGGGRPSKTISTTDGTETPANTIAKTGEPTTPFTVASVSSTCLRLPLKTRIVAFDRAEPVGGFASSSRSPRQPTRRDLPPTRISVDDRSLPTSRSHDLRSSVTSVVTPVVQALGSRRLPAKASEGRTRVSRADTTRHLARETVMHRRGSNVDAPTPADRVK